MFVTHEAWGIVALAWVSMVVTANAHSCSFQGTEWPADQRHGEGPCRGARRRRRRERTGARVDVRVVVGAAAVDVAAACALCVNGHKASVELGPPCRPIVLPSRRAALRKADTGLCQRDGRHAERYCRKSLLSRPIANASASTRRIDLAAMQARVAASVAAAAAAAPHGRRRCSKRRCINLQALTTAKALPRPRWCGNDALPRGEDLAKLKDRINAAVEAGDSETVLTVLRDCLPCQSLVHASNRIGVGVGPRATAGCATLQGASSTCGRTAQGTQGSERATKHGLLRRC